MSDIGPSWPACSYFTLKTWVHGEMPLWDASNEYNTFSGERRKISTFSWKKMCLVWSYQWVSLNNMMIWCFTSISTWLQGFLQWSVVQSWAEFRHVHAVWSDPTLVANMIRSFGIIKEKWHGSRTIIKENGMHSDRTVQICRLIWVYNTNQVIRLIFSSPRAQHAWGELLWLPCVWRPSCVVHNLLQMAAP